MKIAIIDSGVNPGHPHVGDVAGAVTLTLNGEMNDTIDRLGHGTAVAGAIREKMPNAELYALKVFDRRLSAEIRSILTALQWCRDHAIDLVNLSLGTTNVAHKESLSHMIGSDLLVVSAAGALPGDLPGVIGVAPDRDCPRDSFRYRDGVFFASPYPRPIPGIAVDRNLHGVSFAVANMTALVARLLAEVAPLDIRNALIERAQNTASINLY
ncbi:MAG: S8 family serine peptidase [Bryobacterales bacterium]|nr:S8 family serine peptidase [Bryobacterales bacterium]